MLKVGRYKTIGKFEAHVIFVDDEGRGSGYVVKYPGGKRAMSWWSNGENVVYTNALYDLILTPPTITIPETTLPMPMREMPEQGERFYCLSFDCCNGWKVGERVWRNKYLYDDIIFFTGMSFRTQEDTQVWADFLNKYLAGK